MLESNLWTLEELYKLRSLRNLDLSCPLIHQRMSHRSVVSIRTVLKTLDQRIKEFEDGTKKNKAWTKKRLQELEDLVNKFYTYEQLAEHFNCTPTNIYYTMRRYGLSSLNDGGQTRKYDYVLIGKLADEGMSAREIAKRVGCSLRTAFRLSAELRSICPCCKRRMVS